MESNPSKSHRIGSVFLCVHVVLPLFLPSNCTFSPRAVDAHPTSPPPSRCRYWRPPIPVRYIYLSSVLVCSSIIHSWKNIIKSTAKNMFAMLLYVWHCQYLRPHICRGGREVAVWKVTRLKCLLFRVLSSESRIRLYRWAKWLMLSIQIIGAVRSIVLTFECIPSANLSCHLSLIEWFVTRLPFGERERQSFSQSRPNINRMINCTACLATL